MNDKIENVICMNQVSLFRMISLEETKLFYEKIISFGNVFFKVDNRFVI